MRLCVTLRDLDKHVEPIILKFKIKDTVLAKNWAKMLINNILKTDHPIEKTYCLHNWQTEWESKYSRNLNVLCEKLNESILQVNKSMNPLGYPYIDLKFSLEILQSDEYRRMMNELHHHFEVLIGQIWNISDWYKKTPDEKTRLAIRMLNNYCHEIEGIVNNILNAAIIKENQLKGHDVHNSLSIFLSYNGVNSKNQYFHNKKIHYLTIDEHKCFEEEISWGDVQIFYAQLGKSHLEAFNDKDEIIDRTNISSYQTLTGESVISFNSDYSLTSEFKKWCIDNNFDYTDKTLGIGFPVVAKFENPFTSKVELEQNLRKRNDVYKVSVEDDNGLEIASQIYDYTWIDEEKWKEQT